MKYLFIYFSYPASICLQMVTGEYGHFLASDSQRVTFPLPLPELHDQLISLPNSNKKKSPLCFVFKCFSSMTSRNYFKRGLCVLLWQGQGCLHGLWSPSLSSGNRLALIGGCLCHNLRAMLFSEIQNSPLLLIWINHCSVVDFRAWVFPPPSQFPLFQNMFSKMQSSLYACFPGYMYSHVLAEVAKK